MSSKISIFRTCEFCGSRFEAKTTITKYCSHKCNSRHYKEKVKEQKIAISDKDSAMRQNEIKIALAGTKEIFKVREVSELFGFSMNSIYEMISSGRLKAKNFGERKIRILRTDIFTIFEEPQPSSPPSASKVIKPESNKQLTKEDCYSIGDLTGIFSKTRDDLYTFLKRHGIPKIKVGKEVFYCRKAVDKLHRAWNTPKVAGLEKERERNEKLSKKQLTKRDCYSIDECVKLLNRERGLVYGLLNRRNVPKLRIGHEIYRSKAAVDKLLKTLKEEEGI